jgi:hypothetical protein
MLKKTKWRRRTMAAVAVLALAPVIPGILLAEAHSFTAPSTVTIAYNATADNFHGRVSSDRTLCLGARNVNVYKVVDGTNPLIGITTSGSQGGWTVPKSNAKGTFYALALRSESGGYGNSHVCLQARSPNLKVKA